MFYRFNTRDYLNYIAHTYSYSRELRDRSRGTFGDADDRIRRGFQCRTKIEGPRIASRIPSVRMPCSRMARRDVTRRVATLFYAAPHRAESPRRGQCGSLQKKVTASMPVKGTCVTRIQKWYTGMTGRELNFIGF